MGLQGGDVEAPQVTSPSAVVSASCPRGSPPSRGPSQGPLFRWAWEKHGSLAAACERVAEVVGQLPPIAKVFLAVLFLVDVATVAASGALGGENTGTWVGLAVVYCVFQFVYAFYAVYAQNEYTFVACVALLVAESVFVTVDWRRNFTGRGISRAFLVTQWGVFALVLGLVVATYRSMDGFGWKAFREVGTRADKLRVHQDYRRFSAALSADLFASVMCGVLAVSLVDWPVAALPSAVTFCVVGPVIGWWPWKKAVRGEHRRLVGGLLLVYALGGALFAAALCVAVVRILKGDDYHRLEGAGRRFPSAVTLLVSCSWALLLRALLCYFACRCISSFGSGMLQGLDIARRLQRSVTPAPPDYTEGGATRYDYAWGRADVVPYVSVPGVEPQSTPPPPPELHGSPSPSATSGRPRYYSSTPTQGASRPPASCSPGPGPSRTPESRPRASSSGAAGPPRSLPPAVSPRLAPQPQIQHAVVLN